MYPVAIGLKVCTRSPFFYGPIYFGACMNKEARGCDVEGRKDIFIYNLNCSFDKVLDNTKLHTL